MDIDELASPAVAAVGWPAVPVAALVARLYRHPAVELALGADLRVITMHVARLRHPIAFLHPALAFFFHEVSVESL